MCLPLPRKVLYNSQKVKKYLPHLEYLPHQSEKKKRKNQNLARGMEKVCVCAVSSKAMLF